MENHAFNLFPLENQKELKISYRLVDVVGEYGFGSDDPDLAFRNLNLLAKKIAFGKKLPIAILKGGEKPVLAVAADRPFTADSCQLTPHVVSFEPRDEVHNVEFADLDSDTLEIALSFLSWELRGHLYSDGRLWRSGASTFYRRKPIASVRGLEIYGGFSPRFVYIDDTIHLSVPVVYCYTESKWADSYGDNDVRKLGGHKMLYHYGSKMFPIKFQKRTGKSIRDQRFIPEDGQGESNVFDWTIRDCGPTPGGRPLNPDSPAITYKNMGSNAGRFGALSLCKLALSNDDERVAADRREHQRTPKERMESAVKIVDAHMSKLFLGKVALKISNAPRKVPGKRFPYPATLFGSGHVLRVGNNPHNGEVRLADLGRTRVRLLEDPAVGFAIRSDLEEQVIIAPRSLSPAIINTVKSRIEKFASSIRQKPVSMHLVRYNDETTRTLQQQVESVVKALDDNEIVSGRGVFILPPRPEPHLHNYLKKSLRDRVQFQCMASSRVRRFFDDRGQVKPGMDGKLRSYLFNVGMGLMIVNRQWPWVLHGPTHYDAYIGLDVLGHTAAMSFFYEGGRICAMRDQTSGDKERLSQRVVAKLIYDGLSEDLPDLDHLPRSIVLRRDGRLYDSEWLGFKDAVQRLVAEGKLPHDVQLGAIEVPKHNSYGIRLVSCDGGYFKNPTVGCWEKISETEGVVCSTGEPFRIPGTVEPLVVLVAQGELEIQHVLEDTFAMTQLAWPAPSACMRLPIDLKLCDEQLRAYSAEADEDRVVFGEAVEGEEEEMSFAGAK